MKLFNSFQAVVMFCLMPLVIQWLANAEFAGHLVAYYGSWTLYALMFICAVYVVFCYMDDEK